MFVVDCFKWKTFLIHQQTIKNKTKTTGKGRKSKNKTKLLLSVCVCVAPSPSNLCCWEIHWEEARPCVVSAFVSMCLYVAAGLMNRRFYGASASPPHRDQPPPPVVERRRCRSSSSRPRPGFQWRSVLFIFYYSFHKKKHWKHFLPPSVWNNVFFLSLSRRWRRRNTHGTRDRVYVCVLVNALLKGVLFSHYTDVRVYVCVV